MFVGKDGQYLQRRVIKIRPNTSAFVEKGNIHMARYISICGEGCQKCGQIYKCLRRRVIQIWPNIKHLWRRVTSFLEKGDVSGMARYISICGER